MSREPRITFLVHFFLWTCSLYCNAWCLCQYRYAAETFIFSLLPLQPFTSCSVVQSSFKRQIFVLVNKYSKWICIFCQLHIQIRFHHWFCWPSRGKKILDGFTFRTTGDIFKIFLNQNFLKLKPRHQFLDNSNDDNDIKKTLNETNTQIETNKLSKLEKKHQSFYFMNSSGSFSHGSCWFF